MNRQIFKIDYFEIFMKITILFGGKAGQGPNLLSNFLGNALIKNGYYVFIYRDYQSLIRGGHNFNVLTFSDKPISSNEKRLDLIIALDKKTIEIHQKELKKDGILLFDENKGNMYFAGRIFKMFGIDFEYLQDEIKKLSDRIPENLEEAKSGYYDEKRVVYKLKQNKKRLIFKTGSKGISDGAIKSGLDVYYAYPMTPATSVIGELAENQIENNHLVLELESEIAVINAGIGSSITGAKTMIGTSGGGFDLMTESLSLSGMANVPLVIYLASRPGPSTGVATYTSQGDLDLALHAGHGEFNRLVLAPGNLNESEELISQSFYFSQKFGVPVIILSDKHLAESFYTSDEMPVITKSKKSTSLLRYNSYEKDKFGSATEDENIINMNVEKRLKQKKEIEEETKKFETFKKYGKAKNKKNIIVGWGSTKGVIIDAISDLDINFLQILYLEPFPKEIKKEIEGKNIILIENNATAQLGRLIAEKTGIIIPDKNKILRYDGRPFFCDELKEEIKKRIKK